MATVVTGTLIDSLGQKWSNAPIQFVFRPTPSTPGPYTISGLNFDMMPPAITTDANGSFAITLPANSDIQPALSNWQMIIGPNSTYPAIVLNLYVTGSTYDVSTLFTQSGAVKQVMSLPIPRAYADSEVTVIPNVGQIYYNVTEKGIKYYESGNWVPIGGGFQGMVYPPAGIGVSTGNSWAASIDPATIANLNTNNTFNGNQTINGILSALSFALNSGNLRIGDRSPAFDVGSPNINSDGSSLILNPSASGKVYLNWDQGQGIVFGNGAQSQVGTIDNAGNLSMNGNGSFGGTIQAFSGQIQHNLDVGSLTVGGAAPAGYVLMGNGTNFVAQPLPTPPLPTLNTTAFDVSGSRSFGTIYQNTSNGPRIISGTGRTNGGSVGSTQVLIGSGTPNIQAWGMTGAATISQGVIGFYALVPPGWFYQVVANSLSQGPGGGNAVFAVGSWLEEQIYLS